MAETNDLRTRFGINAALWADLLNWQNQRGAPHALATKIFACLESEASTSEWVDQAMDLHQELNASIHVYSGWGTTLRLRALDRDNDVNPCGCVGLGRYCWYASQKLWHDCCAFVDCVHRQRRQRVLEDAARCRFYGFDTNSYSRLRTKKPDVFNSLYFAETRNPAGVRAVALALLHHQRYQSGRRPHRVDGRRIVHELMAAAAKFNGPRLWVNGVADSSSYFPVQDHLVDCATEILQRLYPLALIDRRGRLARRERLVQKCISLAGERHIYHRPGSFQFLPIDQSLFYLQMQEAVRPRRHAEPMPQCQWHSHRFAEPPTFGPQVSLRKFNFLQEVIPVPNSGPNLATIFGALTAICKRFHL